MENEKPAKRHSLLPQRSASAVSNRTSDAEEPGRLAPAASVKNRDVSPSKLPVGGLKRAQTSQKPSIASSRNVSSRQPGHKAQSSSVNLPRQREGTASGSQARNPPSLQKPVIRKTGPVRPTSSTAKSVAGKTESAEASSRSGHSHSASRLEQSTTSPTKEAKTSARTLANVKVQRPAAATTSNGRPSSPKKPASARKPSGPVINKYALLTTPVAAAHRPAQELKIELLHLHMLHKNSQQTKEQWTASAKQHYEKAFNRLLTLEDDLRTSEIDFLEQRNAAALIEWCKEVSSASGESKTRVLSGALDQMWMFVAPGGRYTAAVAAFEDWHAIMERSHDLRSLGHERQHVDVMEGLGDGWKSEVDGLMNSLCLMSDALEGLGPAAEPSDLARCLNVLMTLLANMLEELMLIRDIEQKLVDREGSWVKNRIDHLSAKVSSGDR